MEPVFNSDNSIYRDMNIEYYNAQKNVRPEYEFERRVQDNDDPYMKALFQP